VPLALAATMTLLAEDIMTTPVVTFFAEQTLPLAEDVMHFKHLRHLPVVDDIGRLVGLVSHRDLLRAQISSLLGLTDEQRRARQADVRIWQVMTRDIWTVRPDTDVRAVGRTLLDHEFGCLPVIDGADRIVGIITERDFVKYALDQLDEYRNVCAPGVRTAHAMRRTTAPTAILTVRARSGRAVY
jgi:CBS domain-containing membrane protein